MRRPRGAGYYLSKYVIRGLVDDEFGGDVLSPLDKIFFCFIMEGSGKKWSEVEHNRRIRCSWGNTTIP